jgi:hypothetical protein
MSIFIFISEKQFTSNLRPPVVVAFGNALPFCGFSFHEQTLYIRLAFEMAFELQLSCGAWPGRTAGRAESRPR